MNPETIALILFNLGYAYKTVDGDTFRVYSPEGRYITLAEFEAIKKELEPNTLLFHREEYSGIISIYF